MDHGWDVLIPRLLQDATNQCINVDAAMSGAAGMVDFLESEGQRDNQTILSFLQQFNLLS